MSEVLDELYAAAQEETVERRKRIFRGSKFNLKRKIRQSRPNGQAFVEAISAGHGVNLIAEFKQSSPSEGDINKAWSASEATDVYRRAGAAAMSILTINHKFSGDINFLSEARDAAPDLPILRKDFISDEYQLHEAAAYGADAILLIVAGLEQDRLEHLYKEAESLGLASLVEVHNKKELDRALKIEPKIIGVNNRNLDTKPMTVNLATAEHLAHHIPADTVFVAESGYEITQRWQKQDLRHMGANAVLMGTDIMRQPNPEEAIQTWVENF